MTSADEDFASRRRRGDGRRGPAHAKTSPRWPDAGTGPFAAQGTFAAAPPGGGDPRFGRQDPRWPDPAPPAYQEAGPSAYQADYYQAENPEWTEQPGRPPEYPEWIPQPGYQAEYQGWTEQPPYQAEYPGRTGQPTAQAEYPGWTEQPPYQAEYPGWAGQPAYQAEYPGEAGPYGQYALHPDHPSWPQAPFAPWPAADAPMIDRRPAAPPLPERVRPPYPPQPQFPPRADVPRPVLAPRRDIPLHRDMDLAPTMSETITDVANWGQPDVAYAQPAREQIWDAGASQLANWIIEDANEQASAITREARSQASSSLADAQQEAAELVRRTGEQAALTLGAAELQAAEIRSTMMRLTSELTGMAAYVTQALGTAPPTQAPPTPTPPTPTPSTPAAPSSAAMAFAPPATERAARPAGKTNAKSRQHAAVRVMSIFTAAMVLFALTAGGAEVALHGFKFFVFRSAGTGETGRNGGLQENQGPGQSDAPGAHQLQKPQP
jgi:hypothetical protein